MAEVAANVRILSVQVQGISTVLPRVAVKTLFIPVSHDLVIQSDPG
jgi:hypothetical protein